MSAKKKNDKQRGREEGFITGGISATAALLFLLGGGLLIVGWKYLQNQAENNKKAKELQDSYIEEVDELRGYMATGAYDQAGLDIRNKALDDKAKLLEKYGTNWISDTASKVSELLKNYGVYGWIVPFAVIITGAIIYLLIKHWPKNPPTNRCDKDGQTFTDAAALQQHIEAEHQPTEDQKALDNAQAQFQVLATWVQGAVATESGIEMAAYGRWRSLSRGQKLNLVYGLEAVAAYAASSAGLGALAPIAILLLI